MRIGIHTGVLIGGIIGTEVVRYDIYGADNMIANDMESNGKVNFFKKIFIILIEWACNGKWSN